MEFLTSQKKQRKITRNGYVYIFQKDLASQLQSFECQLERKGQRKVERKVNDTHPWHMTQTMTLTHHLKQAVKYFVLIVQLKTDMKKHAIRLNKILLLLILQIQRQHWWIYQNLII